jgi:outer membrane protein assembly factor BamB
MSVINKCLFFLTALLVCSWIAFGQSRGGNWPTFGGDAQRSGWEGADAILSKDSVKNLQLLWKLKLEVQSRGMRPLMPPLIVGRLISYRGFRELAFVGANSDIVYSVDTDLGALFWTKHLEYSTREPQVMTSTGRCPGGLTAMPTMPISGRGGAGGRGAPAQGAAPPGQRGSPFIGGPGPASVYAISSDGRLHRLNISTGDDITQPVSVLPANVRAGSLNMVDNVIYTVTSQECNDHPDAVWAIDLAVDPVKVRSFELKGTSWALGGPVIGADGAVYVQTRDNGLVALTPRELRLKDRFSPKASNSGEPLNAASPVVFSFNNRELVAMSCESGRICLLDAASLGGNDHATPLHRTAQIVQRMDAGVWGSLSSWQDMDGTRWVLASVLGAPHPELKAPVTNGPATNGFIAAFKVGVQGGAATLTPTWVSRDLDSPLPPVIANGVVFALSAGEFTRQIRTSDGETVVEERPRGSTRATLYAFDAQTGKELYSSRNLVTVPASLTGLTVTNGRLYFGGIDGTLYAFGMHMER